MLVASGGPAWLLMVAKSKGNNSSPGFGNCRSKSYGDGGMDGGSTEDLK